MADDPTKTATPGAGADAPAQDEEHAYNRSKSASEIHAALGSVNVLQFDPRRAQMPTQLYIRPEDNVTVNCTTQIAGVILVLVARLLRMDGTIVPYVQTVIQPSGFGSFSNTVKLIEGFLLSLAIINTGTTAKRGQCYVTVNLTRDGVGPTQPSFVLAARYVEGLTTVTWPYPNLQGPSEGPGFMRLITGSTPAAGAEINETVPVNMLWRLVALRTIYTASAAVVTRLPCLQLTQPGGIPGIYPIQTAITASQGADITWAADAPLRDTGLARQMAFTPATFILRPGGAIQTSTASLSVADQYSAPVYLVEEWMEP